MGTSYVNVAGGSINPLQSAQAIAEAQKAVREQANWAIEQGLRNAYSKNLNPDGSLNQTGFLTKAARLGLGPAAVKTWLDTQNATNEAAMKQTQGNAVLQMYGLNPNALRQQDRIGAPVAPQAHVAPKPMTAPQQSGVTGAATTTAGVQEEAPKDERTFKDRLAEMFGFTKPATKEQFAYLQGDKRYESDKPLSESASGVVGNAEKAIVGYDDNFNPIYADQQAGYKLDNAGMLTGNSSGKIGSNVGIAQDASVLEGQSFTPVAPSADNGYRPAPQAPVAQSAPVAPQAPMQDQRSILERLADSGSGIPQIKTADVKPITEAQVASMPKLQRDEFVQGLRNIGITFPGKGGPTNKEIAEAMTEVQRNAVASLYAGTNPLDPTKIGEMLAIGQGASAAAQKALVDLAASGRETATTRIGNKGAVQQQAQSATEFAQVQDQVKDYKRRGYNATSSNVDAVAEADANYEQVNEMRAKTKHDMEPDSYAMKASNDDFNVEIADRLRNLATLEGVNTESADERFMGLIRKNPSWGEIAYSAGSPKEFLANLVRKGMGSKERIDILKTIDKMLESSMSDAGNVGKARNKYLAKKGADAFVPTGDGTRERPYPYTRGMKTYKGKFYNVGGIVVEGKN